MQEGTITAQQAVCPMEQQESYPFIEAIRQSVKNVVENYGEQKQAFKDGMNLGTLTIRDGQVCTTSYETVEQQLQTFRLLTHIYNEHNLTIYDKLGHIVPWCFYRAVQLPDEDYLITHNLPMPLVSSCTSSLEFAIQWLHGKGGNCCILKIGVRQGMFVPLDVYRAEQSEIILQPGLFRPTSGNSVVYTGPTGEKFGFRMITGWFDPWNYAKAQQYLEENRCPVQEIVGGARAQAGYGDPDDDVWD